MISSMEPVLPLYLQSTFGLDVSKIGLVYIAAVVPSFICRFSLFKAVSTSRRSRIYPQRPR